MCKLEILNKRKFKEGDTGIFTEQEINDFIVKIFAGTITLEQLSPAMYDAIARYLTEGVFEGFGKTLIGLDFGTPDYNMLYALRENVYRFSAAKTFQQTKEMMSFILDGDNIRSFNEFKKLALNVFEDYNLNYLEAEYNNAIASARMASKWMDIERDAETLPYIQYQTVGDARVRQEHAVLDNIIKRYDDPFWNTYFPPNDWNCRCTVIQLDEAEETDLTGLDPLEVDPVFDFNPGKDRIVFSNKHPYYEVERKYRELKNNNFNLPLPV